MIEKVNIKRFGSFKEFNWNKNVDSKFEGLNIIYGRNYSGKTTLSRVFRSLEQKKLHPDFLNGEFNIELSEKKTLNSSELTNSDLKIRVYNSDFQKDNLSFLFDKDGEIIPFAILGEHNVETERKIAAESLNLASNKKKLEGNDKEQGLIEQSKKIGKELDGLINSLDNKLREKAKNIKKDSNLFSLAKKADYNIRDIKSEIKNAKVLQDSEKGKLLEILAEHEKKPLNKLVSFSPNLEIFIEESNELLRKSIFPSKSIESLLNDSQLQQWVEEGIQHHRGKKEKCAFCDSTLTAEVWQRLDSHFTKEGEEHKQKISTLINKISNHIKEFDSINPHNSSDLYKELQQEYEDILTEWTRLKSEYSSDINYILKQLAHRLDNIYNEYHLDLSKINRSSELITNTILNINNIIEKNNSYSSNLSQKKDSAMISLRYNEIYNFLVEIDYSGEEERIKDKEILLKDKKREIEEIEAIIRKQQTEIERLRALLNDELKAAEKVNNYLSVSLGHPELSLNVKKDENNNNSTFVINRYGDIAYNLSEGEQTLISFSYFLATLKDIPENEKSDFRIFIDDPICSLDGSNIFYIFSLIESEILLGDFAQVFISTHNMDFLKYLYKSNCRNKKSYFMIERQLNEKSESTSKLFIMPKYLKKYVTEFVFLFEQIYKVANEEQSDDNYHVFYNFPNNARKFLESYLFFKYPDTKINFDQRLAKFFGESIGSVTFLQRINNEFSHGEEQFDRLSKPIDIPEFKKDAKLILDTIKQRDSEQYDSLKISIQ